MCTGGPSLPPPQAPPPLPSTSDPSVLAAAEDQRRRQAALRYQTLLTPGKAAGVPATPQNAAPPPKTLIGA